jgi:hypothetical protein
MQALSQTIMSMPRTFKTARGTAFNLIYGLCVPHAPCRDFSHWVLGSERLLNTREDEAMFR